MISLVFFGCGAAFDVDTSQPNSLDVRLLNDHGSADARLAANGPHALTLKVSALSMDGDSLPVSGPVRIKAITGLFYGPERDLINASGSRTTCTKELHMDLVAGQPVSLTLAAGYGDVHIIVEDLTHHVQGASDTIFMEQPSLTTLQQPLPTLDQLDCVVDLETITKSGCDNVDSSGYWEQSNSWEQSPWVESFMHIESGHMLVTATTLNGFFVTDICQPTYNSLYVFSFNRPNADVGDRLSYVSGVVSEYYNLTEMSHDNLEVMSSDNPLPCPIKITKEMISNGGNEFLETLEGALVWVDDVRIKSEPDPYGQWQVKAENSPGILLKVQSNETAPDFHPADFAGNKIDIVGNLRQHCKSSDMQYILTPRNRDDIYENGDRDEACTPPVADCN